VHIRGDSRADYDAVGRIVYAVQRAGIAKIGSSPSRRCAARRHEDANMGMNVGTGAGRASPT